MWAGLSRFDFGCSRRESDIGRDEEIVGEWKVSLRTWTNEATERFKLGQADVENWSKKKKMKLKCEASSKKMPQKV